MTHDRRDRPEPIISLWGNSVALGPPDGETLRLFEAWENDTVVAHLSGDPVRPTSGEAAAAAFRQEAPDAVSFALYERSTLRCIGMTGLRRIDHARGTAEFGISIGERDCWGKGHGTEATRLILDYAFTTLGLRAVLLEVYAFNERGIGAYRRAGFREVGRRRAAHRAVAAAHDIVLMECLASEFHADP
jgi:diamine N-acetyltransferase